MGPAPSGRGSHREIAGSRPSPVLCRTRGGGSSLHKFLGESATPRRKPDRHGAALAGFRVELNAASQGLRPPPHARDPGATRPSWRLLHWIQSLSVVFDGEPDLTLDELQVGLDCRATGMAGDIVNALLEHQEQLPPRLKTQVRVFSRLGSSQLEADALAGEQIKSEFAHAPDQRIQVIR